MIHQRQTRLALFHTPSAAAWADARMAQLSPDERIAQLLHVPAWSNRDETHTTHLLAQVQAGVGGIVFFQGDPLAQARLTNACQAVAKVPLMISIDAEWGLAMRLADTVAYPYAITLGALSDTSLIYEMGRQLGRQCRRLGIQMNHAPAVDINVHPLNPVIGFRSFGSNSGAVTRRALAYMQGMQDEQVLAVAKHFPGHGDTSRDSHTSLPVLSHTLERLAAVELVPFQALMDAGVGAVMTAHLQLPALDDRPDRGACLSRAITTGLLQEEMGFQGLVVTDALDMRGASAFFEPGAVEAEALMAGNDILLFTVDVPAAIRSIQALVARGEISQAEIDRRCHKTLMAKYHTGLHTHTPVVLEGLPGDLCPPEAQALNTRVGREAVTLLRRPVWDPARTAVLSLFIHGDGNRGDALAHHQLTRGQHGPVADRTAFEVAAADRGVAHVHRITPADLDRADTLLETLRDVSHVLVPIHGIHVKAGDRFQISQEAISLLRRLLETGKVTPVIFGSPYTLLIWEGLAYAQGLVMAYQDADWMQTAAIEVLAGEIPAQGRLPVSLGDAWSLGAGLT
ncbi:MAG: glycoside hydrolase family 3 N-terminal domain-containing protein [Bacteroidia bacterium]|nr:glycoside hydrolase family 3 N-terminal domain-containing protein [Bacteroidia bacterium]